MKTILLAMSAVMCSVCFTSGQNNNSNAQSNWKSNGNNASTGDYLGTTNNSPLIFKTNNQVRGKFEANGDFILDNGNLTLNPLGLSNPSSQHLFKVGGSGHFETDLNVKQDLSVHGNALFKNTLTAEKGIMFDVLNGLKYTPASNGVAEKYILGNVQVPLATCLKPNTNPWFYLQGGFISRAQNGMVDASLTMASANWDGSGIIEVEGSDDKGGTTNSLLVNYFCGRNTNLNTNNALPNKGGWVNMGEQVNMAKHVEIGSVQWGISDPLNTALEIHVNDGKGIKFRSWNSSVKLISVENPAFPGASPFTVFADGKTHIGHKNQSLSPLHSDALLTVNGKLVTQSCYVTISNWADFVFEENYKIPELKDIEAFYKANKHLPEIPSAKEVLKEGVDLAEMNRLLLKKVEELTIIMVDQDKKLNGCLSEIAKLKNTSEK
ncbi:MAG: hypothetical protein ACJ76F_11695 [Bacteroidia bacterium]